MDRHLGPAAGGPEAGETLVHGRRRRRRVGELRPAAGDAVASVTKTSYVAGRGGGCRGEDFRFGQHFHGAGRGNADVRRVAPDRKPLPLDRHDRPAAAGTEIRARCSVTSGGGVTPGADAHTVPTCSRSSGPRSAQRCRPRRARRSPRTSRLCPFGSFERSSVAVQRGARAREQPSPAGLDAASGAPISAVFAVAR